MTAKRTPPNEEIMAMAEQLRPFVKTGETVVPFIRRNQQRLLQLLEEESWATVARVMTALGVTYSTGKPWTARYIANEFDRATMPRKRRRGMRSEAPSTAASLGVEPSAKPLAPSAPPTPEPTPPAIAAAAQTQRPIETPADVQAAPIREKVPRFRPASLKPYEPPRALTPDEIKEREANRVRIFGP